MLFKARRAQATVEYVALFLIVLSLFVLFLGNVKGTFRNYHQRMVERAAGG